MNAQTPMRIGFAALAICLMVAAPMVYSDFYAHYFTVSARVAPNAHEYDLRLKQALHYDPSYNYANQLMAQYALREGKLGAAREYQLAAMRSFVSVSSLERMGTILARLNRRSEARELLEQAARVNPGNVAAREQLAGFAFEEGDSARLEQLTAEILRRDMNNLNAWYLRALDAQRTGNAEAALHGLQRVSAGLAAGEDARARFGGTREEVAQRLAELQRTIDRQ